MTGLAARINAELNLRGWTKADLSRRSGVSAATIGRLLSGEGWDTVRTATLQGFASAFGWPFDPAKGEFVPPELGEGRPVIPGPRLRGRAIETLDPDLLRPITHAGNSEELVEALRFAAEQLASQKAAVATPRKRVIAATIEEAAAGARLYIDQLESLAKTYRRELQERMSTKK